MKKFVLFWLKEPYSDDDVKKRKKLNRRFKESGVLFETINQGIRTWK